MRDQILNWYIAKIFGYMGERAYGRACIWESAHMGEHAYASEYARLTVSGKIFMKVP